MEDSVATRVLVHECTLAGTTLIEEPFQREGQGSAFVSRPNELVVVVASTGGLPAIQAKITQLVEKGFHYIIVSVAGIKSLERDTLKLLLKARAYVENWAGFLHLADVSPELLSLVRTLGLEKDLNPQGTRADAVEGWKRSLGASSSAGATSLDLGMEMPKAGPGKTSLDLPLEMPPAAGAKELPAVDVAELVVPAEELPKLRRQIESVLGRGKRYVTMRLSFKKRMRSEDVQLLTEARDLLSENNGQLVLASLQQDVATWLKLLDYDREFVISEDADQAELAHRRHAAGAGSRPAPAKKATGTIAKAWTVVSRTDAAVVVRSPSATGSFRTKAPIAVVEVERAGLPNVLAEVERLGSSGARDIIFDLKAFEQPRGERLEPLGEAVALAQIKGVRVTFARVSRELRAFLKLVGLESKLATFEDQDGAFLRHAEQLHAQARFDELELGVTRRKLGAQSPQTASELVLSESAVTFNDTQEMPISSAEAELRMELQKAINEAEKQKRANDAAGQRIRELEAAVQQARAQGARPAETKIVEKIVEKRVEVPVERIVDRVVEKIVEKRVEVPVERIVDRVVEKVVEKRVEVPVDRVVEKASNDGGELARVQGELAKAQEKLDFVEARYREADYARNELGQIARSSDDARKRFQTEIEQWEAKARTADAKLDKLQAELDTQTNHWGARVKDLEQQVSQSAKAKTTSASGGAASPELEARVQRLEREKAEILLESKREIERLSREQETLREELESAGDMIERLGKELELT